MKRYLIIPILLAVILPACIQEGKEEVQVVKLSPRDMVEQLKLGEIDAFVAWEPFASEAVVNGYGKVMATSHDIWPNHPCCVVAAQKNVDKDILTAIVWAHVKATRFINDERNRENVIEYAMEFTGKDRAVIEEALKRIKFVEYPDKKEFKKYYEKLKENGYITKTPQDLGYESEEEFFNDFLDDSVYNQVIENLSKNVSWIPKKVNATVRMGYLTADLHQLAFYVALKEGYYEDVGLNIVKKEFTNGVFEMEGFKQNEIDVGYLGGSPATLKRVNDNIKIKIIAGANNEGSAIVVRSDISDPKDLAGKKIAIPGYGTVQDFLLRLFVEKNGLRLK